MNIMLTEEKIYIRRIFMRVRKAYVSCTFEQRCDVWIVHPEEEFLSYLIDFALFIVFIFLVFADNM